MTSESWVLCHADTFNFGLLALDFITSLDLSWFPIRPQLVPHDFLERSGFPCRLVSWEAGGIAHTPSLPLVSHSHCQAWFHPRFTQGSIIVYNHGAAVPSLLGGSCLGDQDGVIFACSSLGKWYFGFFGLALRYRKFCNCYHSGYHLRLLMIIFHIPQEESKASLKAGKAHLAQCLEESSFAINSILLM